jgi:hypothetical protein
MNIMPPSVLGMLQVPPELQSTTAPFTNPHACPLGAVPIA